MAVPQPEAPEYRPWHLQECPARSGAVADEDACAVCTCPAERFLDPWAEPVRDDRTQDNTLALAE